MVRQVSGLVSRTYEERLMELGLTKLEERRHQSDLHMAFKILKGIEDVPTDEFFTMAAATANGQHTRRNAGHMNLRAAHGRLDLRANFFTVRVAEHWNRVPEELKRLTTIGAFKKAYAQHRQPTT